MEGLDPASTTDSPTGHTVAYSLQSSPMARPTQHLPHFNSMRLELKQYASHPPDFWGGIALTTLRYAMAMIPFLSAPSA